ncbi:unnamed protein product [Sphenostylis stenocarpa]|uniref:Uncharacterized protein n=1 Tax=Sphenostylis stenocarpa TaxID=92480 RepID=A0AA86SDA2_9FABA|nr:unnamed protein product [Sphenostylis stenocarpa]
MKLTAIWISLLTEYIYRFTSDHANLERSGEAEDGTWQSMERWCGSGKRTGHTCLVKGGRVDKPWIRTYFSSSYGHLVFCRVVDLFQGLPVLFPHPICPLLATSSSRDFHRRKIKSGD